MKIVKDKKTIAIALFLMLTIAFSFVALPNVTAQTLTFTRKAFAYIGATPNPIGVGQETLLHIGMKDELQSTADGWKGLSVTIETPDGETETISNINTDATGGTGRTYIPSIAGNYTLQTHFPAQWQNVTSMYGAANIYYEATSSEKLTLVVQEELVPIYQPNPLPTEYWTRPIDAELREWYTITGNWLTTYPPNRFALYNEDAPESAHILWAKQLAGGGIGDGLIGRDNTTHSYECGGAYENKFQYSLIIAGVLYYNQYESRGQPYAEQIVVAVDLKTGEELWSKPLIGRVARAGTTAADTVSDTNKVIDGVSEQFPDGIGRRLSFGQQFYWDSYNYHGVYGILWTTSGSTWMAFDATTGRWIYTIMNVPSGTTVYGVNGELLRLVVNLGAGWMAMWNSSRLVSPDGSWNPHGNIYNATGIGAGATSAWEWNVTIPKLPGSVAHVLEDRIIGSDYGSDRYLQQAIVRQNDPVVLWGLSIAPGKEGTLLFNTTWQAPTDETVYSKSASLEEGVFIITAKESATHYAFDIDTGAYLWGPTEPQHYLDSMSILLYGAARTAYGRVYSQSMSGILYCYDVKTGDLLWTYEPVDPYNQVLWSTHWTSIVMFIADGKIYMGNYEHSPIDPKPRGAPLICVNATTGEEIWRMNGVWPTSYSPDAIIGDSTIALLDVYDNRIYAYGKGPSATTASASPKVTVHGNGILIEGMVTDVSPGTEDYALRARFPNGVPAVSDGSMSDWMLYVYKQFARPANATGVEVTLDVLDANGNYRNIGTATSDANGFYSFAWEPDIPGKYTVYARFAGSAGYYGSFAETAFVVDETPQATPEPTPTPAPMTDMYVLSIGAGAIIAIAVVGLVIILMLRKR
jgi:outer membrane protein assembly factor BamB